MKHFILLTFTALLTFQVFAEQRPVQPEIPVLPEILVPPETPVPPDENPSVETVPPVITIPIRRDAPPDALINQFLDSFPTRAEPLTEDQKQSILDHLGQPQPAPLDIEELGFEYPGRAISLCVRRQHGIPTQVIHCEAFPKWDLPEGETIEPVGLHFGEANLAFIKDVIRVAIEQACSLEPRPIEFIITLSAGIDFYASFKGQITLKFDLGTACSE